MTLSDLKTGDEAYIVKVKGHGGFRKRIVEMGFIKGQRVDVLQCAPLQDPVKYKVMGYEVSLRRQEAEKIEVTQVRRIMPSILPVIPSMSHLLAIPTVARRRSLILLRVRTNT